MKIRPEWIRIKTIINDKEINIVETENINTAKNMVMLSHCPITIEESVYKGSYGAFCEYLLRIYIECLKIDRSFDDTTCAKSFKEEIKRYWNERKGLKEIIEITLQKIENNRFGL